MAAPVCSRGTHHGASRGTAPRTRREAPITDRWRYVLTVEDGPDLRQRLGQKPGDVHLGETDAFTDLCLSQVPKEPQADDEPFPFR